jgi:ParB-like chromosome segregation protein Spo0J
MTIDASRRRSVAHPASSGRTETILSDRHISYSFEPNLALDEIRMPEGHQVRLMEHRAPKVIVNAYAVQMQQGAVFPAIVVSDEFGIIDGNTRLAAAIRCRAKSIPAYVCAAMTALEIRSLSIELNQIHGQRMTIGEVRNFIVGCARSGIAVEPTALARSTGVRPSTIARWLTIEHSRARAAAHGLSIEKLSDSAIAALARARLDAVFVELVAVATTGRVSASRLGVIAAEANSALSESEAVAVVTREKQAASSSADRDPSTRRSCGSAFHIGGLLRFAVDDFLDVPPDRQPEAYTNLCMVRDLLDAAVSEAENAWRLDGSMRRQPGELLEVG